MPQKEFHRYWITEFLTTYSPSFCWVTEKDLLLMAEQINEDVCPLVFKQIVCNLKRQGLYHVRNGQGPHHSTGKKPVEYLRKESSNAKSAR